MRQHIYRDKKEMRLDSWLLQKYPALNYGMLNKFLRENKIKVNGKKPALNSRLINNDEIKLFINDDILVPNIDSAPFLRARKDMSVIFEDENLIIVDKPAGLSVNDEQEKSCDTLINRVLLYLYNKHEYKNNESSFTPCLCHRLDTGTSGLVICAKNEKAEAFIRDMITAREIKKEYLCVTFGRPPQKADTLKGYLTKNAEKGTVRVSDKPLNKLSKPIETRYEVIKISGRLSLLNIELITGRTHQIRAHLASIACPILGDSKYGNNKANREFKVKYQALCAYKLTMPKAISNQQFAQYTNKSFQAQIPWYYSQILDNTIF